MWSNLLSGTIGSIIGIAGAVAVALLTVQRTGKQAELERRIEKAGDLAAHLVELYQELKVIDDRGLDPTSADLERIRPLALAFQRSVVVDGPILEPKLEAEMKASRALVAAFITTESHTLSLASVRAARKSVRDSGDSLQGFRSQRRVDQRAKAAVLPDPL